MQDITIRHITEFDPSLTEPIAKLLGQLTSQPVAFTDDDLRAICQSENCRLIFFVTVEGAGGTYVTNVVENDNLTQTITFDYQ